MLIGLGSVKKSRAVEVAFKNLVFLGFKLKISKVDILGFLNLKTSSHKSEFYFFLTCVTNLIQMIFRYELQFVVFTWPNLCLWPVVGRNFVSGICKLKNL